VKVTLSDIGTGINVRHGDIFSPMLDKVAKRCNFGIVVYDTTRPETFDVCESFINRLRQQNKEMVVALIGNIMGHRTQMVPRETGIQLTWKIGAIFCEIDLGHSSENLKTLVLLPVLSSQAFMRAGQQEQSLQPEEWLAVPVDDGELLTQRERLLSVLDAASAVAMTQMPLMSVRSAGVWTVKCSKGPYPAIIVLSKVIWYAARLFSFIPTPSGEAPDAKQGAVPLSLRCEKIGPAWNTEQEGRDFIETYLDEVLTAPAAGAAPGSAAPAAGGGLFGGAAAAAQPERMPATPSSIHTWRDSAGRTTGSSGYQFGDIAYTLANSVSSMMSCTSEMQHPDEVPPQPQRQRVVRRTVAAQEQQHEKRSAVHVTRLAQDGARKQQESDQRSGGSQGMAAPSAPAWEKKAAQKWPPSLSEDEQARRAQYWVNDDDRRRRQQVEDDADPLLGQRVAGFPQHDPADGLPLEEEEPARPAASRADEARLEASRFVLEEPKWLHEKPAVDSKPATPVPPVDDENECVVCLDAQKSHILIPCGHFCVCEACADRLAVGDGCPICRTPVQIKTRVF